MNTELSLPSKPTSPIPSNLRMPDRFVGVINESEWELFGSALSAQSRSDLATSEELLKTYEAKQVTFSGVQNVLLSTFLDAKRWDEFNRVINVMHSSTETIEHSVGTTLIKALKAIPTFESHLETTLKLLQRSRSGLAGFSFDAILIHTANAGDVERTALVLQGLQSNGSPHHNLQLLTNLRAIIAKRDVATDKLEPFIAECRSFRIRHSPTRGSQQGLAAGTVALPSANHEKFIASLNTHNRKFGRSEIRCRLRDLVHEADPVTITRAIRAVLRVAPNDLTASFYNKLYARMLALNAGSILKETLDQYSAAKIVPPEIVFTDLSRAAVKLIGVNKTLDIVLPWVSKENFIPGAYVSSARLYLCATRHVEALDTCNDYLSFSEARTDEGYTRLLPMIKLMRFEALCFFNREVAKQYASLARPANESLFLQIYKPLCQRFGIPFDR